MKTDFTIKGKYSNDVSCKIYINHPKDDISPYMNVVVTGKNLRVFIFKADRKQMKSLSDNILKAIRYKKRSIKSIK